MCKDVKRDRDYWLAAADAFSFEKLGADQSYGNYVHHMSMFLLKKCVELSEELESQKAINNHLAASLRKHNIGSYHEYD